MAENGLDQKGLSARIGVSQPQIGRYLAGTAEPKASLLAELAREFKKEIGWFFGETSVEEQIDPGPSREVRDLLDQARTVLESGGPGAEALTHNVRFFHMSVMAGVGKPQRRVRCKECSWVGPDPLTEWREGKMTAVCPKCGAEAVLDDEDIPKQVEAARDVIKDPGNRQNRIRKERTRTKG